MNLHSTLKRSHKSLNIIKSTISCTICKELYYTPDRLSYLCPNFHSFCGKCLQTLNSQPNAPHLKFRCAYCTVGFKQINFTINTSNDNYLSIGRELIYLKNNLLRIKDFFSAREKKFKRRYKNLWQSFNAKLIIRKYKTITSIIQKKKKKTTAVPLFTIADTPKSPPPLFEEESNLPSFLVSDNVVLKENLQ